MLQNMKFERFGEKWGDGGERWGMGEKSIPLFLSLPDSPDRRTDWEA